MRNIWGIYYGLNAIYSVWVNINRGLMCRVSIMSLNDAASISTIMQLFLTLIVTFGGGLLALGYLYKMRPVWKRFTDNVNRQIAVISTEKQSMKHEFELLKRVGYFKKIKCLDPDSRNLNLVSNSALIVIGYSPNSKIYRKSFEYAKTYRLPFIVFSGDYRLTKSDIDELKKYSFSSLCETELRLISDVFAAISTFPEIES